MRSVAKASRDKVSVGGRKWALRRRNGNGRASEEVIGIGRPPVDDGDDRELLVPLVVDGEVLPEHVANAVFMLCSAELSHTTGLHIPVDAGVAAAFLR